VNREWDEKSPASYYGGGWFGFEGLCATLLARTGIPDISGKIEKMFA